MKKEHISHRPLVWFFFIIAVQLTACQKVIDVDSGNAAKKTVIEAVLTDQAGGASVLLSSSLNMADRNTFSPITGAQVRISDNAGSNFALTESTPGVYLAPTLVGVPGMTYSLEVIQGDQTFTAVSRMPVKITLDTAYVTDEVLFGETRKLVNIAYQDPSGKGNCYRYVQYVNDRKTKAIFTNNDDYIDGKYIETKLWYLVDEEENPEEEIKSGDKVKIDLLCIDVPIYKYWFSVFQSATGTSQSASPANPVSNIRGGALGYFSAHTFQSTSFVAP
jgi:hypothetical protein